MDSKSIRRLCGAAGFAACLALTAAADQAGKVPASAGLPKPVADRLLAGNIAYLIKALAEDPAKNKPVLPTLKAVAMEVALYAQGRMTGPDADKMAALRDQALRVAETLAAKDYAEAKKAAAGLSNPPTAGGNAKQLDLQTLHKFDLGEVMAAFRNKPRGLNIEKDIRAQAKKVTDVDLAADAAAHSVMYGEFTLLMPSDKATASPAKKARWDALTNDMIKVAVDAAGEAAKGAGADKAALKIKMGKLDATCTACHTEFRDD